MLNSFSVEITLDFQIAQPDVDKDKKTERSICESLNQKIGLRKRDGDPRNNKSFINYSQVDEDVDRNLDFTKDEMKQLEQKRKKINHEGIKNQKTNYHF